MKDISNPLFDSVKYKKSYPLFLAAALNMPLYCNLIADMHVYVV